MTLVEAGKEYGREPSTLRRAIQRKDLEAQLVGKTWIVTPAAMEAYLANVRKPGRPRKESAE